MSFGHDIAELVATHESGLLAKHPSWKRARLSELADVLNGYPYASSYFQNEEGVPLLRIRDIVTGRTETRYNGPVDDPRMIRVRDGDIVVGMDGDFNARIWRGGEALLNQRVCLLRAKDGLYTQAILAYLLPGYLKFINQHTSSVTVKHLSSRTIQDIPLPYPPLSEQKRIVARIDALFAEIDEGEAALAQARQGLETFRRALLKSAMNGELTSGWRKANATEKHISDVLFDAIFDKVLGEEFSTTPRRKRKRPNSALREVYSLPKGWQWTRLGDIGSVTGGLTKNQDREKMPSRAPYLRVANVQMGYLNLSEVKEIGVTRSDVDRASLEHGDLLIVEGNGSIDQIGRCAVWRGEIKGCVHQNHIIKVRFKQSLLSAWCLHWLQSPLGRAEIEKVAASTSGLHTLSISKIEALPVPVPPAVEIEEIIRRLDEGLAAFSDTDSTLNMETGDAARLRQAILKTAFEGKLVDQRAEEEPATDLLSRLAPARDAQKAKGTRARR